MTKAIEEDLRKYARNLTANIQRETSITPSLLLAAADALAESRVEMTPEVRSEIAGIEVVVEDLDLTDGALEVMRSVFARLRKEK